MARKTDGEKIDELMVAVATLGERVRVLEEVVDTLKELDVRVALLEQQMADLRQGREQWLHRVWMLLAPLVGAVVGSLLTYYLNARQ